MEERILGLGAVDQLQEEKKIINEPKEKMCAPPPGLILRAYLYLCSVFVQTNMSAHVLYIERSTCAILLSRTLADGWLVLIHSRGTNLNRQLDPLTDLTADNPAGSFSCNNLGGGGGVFCLGAVSMRHNASPPSSPLQSQRAGYNH